MNTTAATAHKYLLICPSYPPPLVGGHKVWTYNMVEHGPFDFDILTSSLKEGWPEISSPRHTMIRCPQIFSGKSDPIDPTLGDLWRSYTFMMGWLIKRNFSVKYDGVVVHACTFANGLFFLLGRLLGLKVVGMSNAEEFTLALKGRGWKNAVKRLWIRLTHGHAAGFVVVCHFCRDLLVSCGVKRSCIHVVPSSINPGKISPDAAQRRPGMKILSVGRLVERKGFHCLIDAVNLLSCRMPGIELTIVGSGPYQDVLEERVKRYGLRGRVFIRGGLPDEELSRLYRESNLFVLAHMMLPNGDTEGCPTVFSEAGGCGLPVIGGTQAGASTVIVEGVTGFIVDARDTAALAAAIGRVLGDPALAQRMGAAAIEKVKRDHVPAVTGPKFCAAIDKIIKGVPPED